MIFSKEDYNQLNKLNKNKNRDSDREKENDNDKNKDDDKKKLYFKLENERYLLIRQQKSLTIETHVVLT